MAINLSNISDNVKLELDSFKENASSVTGNVASWWSTAQNNIPSRVEATKAAVEKYGYNGVIGNLAASDKIDKYLLLSIITVESNGDPNVVNPYGYFGCMQVDPSSLTSANVDPDPKVNAQKSIESGIRIFKNKHNVYSPDNVWVSIAAYNCGEEIVRRAFPDSSDRNKVRWWQGIEAVAQKADEFYGPTAGKFKEVGEYAIQVLYAYSLFTGYQVTIGDLPAARSTHLDSSAIAGKYSGGQSAPAKQSVSVSQKNHEKHVDSILEAPDKLYCEPVYPDLVYVSNEVPQHLIDEANIPESEMIVGDDMFFQIPVSVLTKYVGDDAISALSYNAKLEEQRKQAFDAEQHRNSFKIPSSGKPANNNDPFPVDAKIEELELHSPRCKISSIQACPEAVSTAKACISLSMNTEKRLVRLENNMATMMRYLNRLSSRISVNCVYWGGTTTYERYKCIRCLRDDRIADGQMMSLDQCLNCTRFEPVIGQVYDILNDQGVNLSHILDDAQMSYTSMDEYCDFVKSTSYQKDLETVGLNVDTVSTRLINEKDFKDIWSNGVKMDWNLFPVEDQVPHINEQQSINENGYSKLGSYQGNTVNFGYSYTGKVKSNKITENKKAMDQLLSSSSSSSDSGDKQEHIAIPAIRKAKSLAESLESQIKDDMKAYLGQNISKLIRESKDSSLDLCLVAALHYAGSGVPVDSIIGKLIELRNSLKTKNVDNLVLLATFFDVDTRYLFGTNNDIESKEWERRLDKVTKFIEEESGESSREGSDGEGTTRREVGFNLDWNSVNNWNWLDFIEPLNINYTHNQEDGNPLSEKLYFFANVAYIYSIVQENASFSHFDNNGLAFPFTEEQLGRIYYTSPFGSRNGGYHYGVDLAGNEGEEIHAIADGVVEYTLTPEEANGGGNMIAIRHDNNLFSRYMHMMALDVSAGQNISKGQVVGRLGNTGHSTGPHLHFEVNVGGAASANAQDPVQYFPILGSVPLGSGLGGN